MPSTSPGLSYSDANSDEGGINLPDVAGRDVDDDAINDTDVPVPTALMPGAVKAYYNDQSKLDAKLKKAYIIMQMADMENRDIIEKHNASVSGEPTKPPPLHTPRSYVACTEPFASLKDQKGKKARKAPNLLLPKKEIAQEIMR